QQFWAEGAGERQAHRSCSRWNSRCGKVPIGGWKRTANEERASRRNTQTAITREGANVVGGGFEYDGQGRQRGARVAVLNHLVRIHEFTGSWHVANVARREIARPEDHPVDRPMHVAGIAVDRVIVIALIRRRSFPDSAKGIGFNG